MCFSLAIFESLQCRFSVICSPRVTSSSLPSTMSLFSAVPNREYVFVVLPEAFTSMEKEQ